MTTHLTKVSFVEGAIRDLYRACGPESDESDSDEESEGNYEEDDGLLIDNLRAQAEAREDDLNGDDFRNLFEEGALSDVACCPDIGQQLALSERVHSSILPSHLSNHTTVSPPFPPSSISAPPVSFVQDSVMYLTGSGDGDSSGASFPPIVLEAPTSAEDDTSFHAATVLAEKATFSEHSSAGMANNLNSLLQNLDLSLSFQPVVPSTCKMPSRVYGRRRRADEQVSKGPSSVAQPGGVGGRNEGVDRSFP